MAKNKKYLRDPAIQLKQFQIVRNNFCYIYLENLILMYNDFLK